MKHLSLRGRIVLTILFAFCVVILSSCTKSSGNKDAVHVYVTGYSGAGAKYWENGNSVILADGENSISTCIAVSGNDVYVAGWVQDRGSDFSPKYWKNGNPVNLIDGTNSGYQPGDIGFYANCIAVSENDVYVAGYINYGALLGERTVAKYWKNGNPVTLSDTSVSSGYATCIAVSGNDVYVAGNVGGYATYWRNGSPVVFSDSSRYAEISSLFVSGNDVYLAGNQEGVPKYWKNGSSVNLADSSQHAIATSITVSGNDVYVSGYNFGLLGGIAALYWKNGNLVTLSGGTEAFGIAVAGNDVYVAGGSGISGATYWKNGSPISLNQGDQAYSIFLTNR